LLNAASWLQGFSWVHKQPKNAAVAADAAATASATAYTAATAASALRLQLEQQRH